MVNESTHLSKAYLVHATLSQLVYELFFCGSTASKNLQPLYFADNILVL